MYSKLTRDMRYFACPFDKIMVRLLLMTGFLTAGVLVGQPLVALLALPLFVSVMLGISFMPEEGPATGEARRTKLRARVVDTAEAA